MLGTMRDLDLVFFCSEEMPPFCSTPPPLSSTVKVRKTTVTWGLRA